MKTHTQIECEAHEGSNVPDDIGLLEAQSEGEPESNTEGTQAGPSNAAGKSPERNPSPASAIEERIRELDLQVARELQEARLLEAQSRLRDARSRVQSLRLQSAHPAERLGFPGPRDVSRALAAGNETRQSVEDLLMDSLSEAYEPQAERADTPISIAKLPTIDKYQGKTVEEHTRFFFRLEQRIRMYPDNFKQESQKILWASLHLHGSPENVWASSWECKHIDQLTWEDFKKFLLDLIIPPKKRTLQDAVKLEGAKQRQGQSVYSFAAYLNDIEIRIGYKETEQARVSRLYTKLLPELQRAVTNHSTVPDKRDALVSLASRLQENLRETQRDYTELYQPRKHKRNESKEQAESRDNKRPRTTSSFKAKRSHLICFTCNEKGHIAPNCPEKGDSKSNTNKTPVGSSWNKLSKKEEEHSKNGRA